MMKKFIKCMVLNVEEMKMIEEYRQMDSRSRELIQCSFCRIQKIREYRTTHEWNESCGQRCIQYKQRCNQAETHTSKSDASCSGSN